MAKRAVLYGRVSGDDARATGGANLQAQIDLCREYAQRQGYVIVAELKEDDRGASGATFDLPQLSKALELARQGAFDVLIARELDRLARDLGKQMIVEQELKRSGVVIEYALYDFPDTPEGRLNKNFRAMLAEYEREKITQRMKRGKLREVNGGSIMPARAPYGYRLIRNENNKFVLEENPEEAATVRLIFDWYINGADGERLSIYSISQKLTTLGIPTAYDSRKGYKLQEVGKWHAGSVTNILHNETYAGTWYYNKETWVKDESNSRRQKRGLEEL